MVKPLGRVGDYFKLNRILLSLLGLWPYQTPGERRIVTSIIVCFSMSQIIPQVVGLVQVKSDFDMIIECLPPLGVDALCVIKLINMTVNNDKMKQLLMSIQSDWDSAITTEEITIMQRYAKHGLKMSKIYAVAIYTAGLLFVTQPLFEDLTSLSILGINNTESSSKRLPFIADYYVDLEKYYYLIMAHCSLCTPTILTIMIAADTIFVVYLHHGCAKFVVLKYRLSQVLEPGKLDADVHLSEKNDLVYQKVKKCVHLHKEAIGFANTIESAYSTSQFFQISLRCLLMSVTGLQAVTKLDKPDEVFRYFGVILGVMLNLLFYCWPSHELMDQSMSVCEATYNTEWYRASKRTQKIMLQMMARSLEPCKITAGKMLLMSMESFCKILSSSMSYFTMLSSVQ